MNFSKYDCRKRMPAVNHFILCCALLLELVIPSLVCKGTDYPVSLDSTYLYALREQSCPPVIREQPQSVSVMVGNPVTLSVGAGDCPTATHPSSTQTSLGPDAQNFEFQTGGSAGQLEFDYEFFTIPDSLRVYYDETLIFESDLSGQGTIRIPFGPGVAQGVNIIVNEDGGPDSTAWEYTVRFRPPPLSFRWRRDGTTLAGETNGTLHFSSVRLEDVGDYSVVVANNHSSTVSAVATLTVLPPPSTECVIAPSGLVSWWSAEDNANDITGSNHGVLSGEVVFAPGEAGHGFLFPAGGVGAVKFAAHPSLDVGTGDGFTVEGWIRPTVSNLSAPIAEWNDGTRWGAHFWVVNGFLYANVTGPGGGWHQVFSSAPIQAGAFHHVALTYDKAGGRARLYLNGEPVAEVVIGSFTPETAFDFYLGRRPSTVEPDSFEGLLDEFSLYRRELSSSEITSIHMSGASGKCPANPPLACNPPGLVALWRGDGDATDAIGAHDGTLLFGATFSPGLAGQAFNFDLGRSRVSVSDDDDFRLTDSLSFEGWINVASLSPGIIFIRGDNRPGLDPYHMGITLSGQLVWGIISMENSSATVVSPGVLATGVWTHVAAVLDGATGNMGLYVDGSLVNQTYTSLRPLRDLDPNSEPALGIGNHGGTLHQFPFHGLVDEWALYSRALSSTEIQTLFNAGAAVKCITNVPPPPIRVYDLSADFSLEANPNGPWSYGRLTESLDGRFELLNTSRTFGAENGVPIALWQRNNAKPWVAKVLGPGMAISFHFNSPAGTIYFGPDPDALPLDFGAIRFTVPLGAGGVYRLETSVRSLYDSTRSADADFHVVKNGVELFGRLVPPNSSMGYSNTLTLTAGDRIDFVAGRGTNGLPDTGLKIQATLVSMDHFSMSVDSVSFLAGGGIRVTGHAPAGTACRVERSANLVEWEPAGLAVEVAAGVFEFIDPQPPLTTANFYRLLSSGQ